MRVLWRIIGRYGQDVRASGCLEKLSFEFLRDAWRYPTEHQPESDAAIERHRTNVTVVRLRRNAQRTKFLASR